MNENKMITPDYIFEVSWEVCNKVGGIHTVITTKAITLENLLGNNYMFIGPDVWKETHDNPEFEEESNSLRYWKEQAASEGLHIKIGRWKIPGRPIVILVDFTPFFSIKDKILAEFWEKYQLDSLMGGWDYLEPALFGYAAGKVIESFYNYNLSSTDKLITHFHEFLTGTGILYLKDRVPQAGLLFTTHATTLARSICSNNLALYRDMETFNPEQSAKNFNMSAQFSLEKVSAALSDCFTTVSEITDRECKTFLKRPADIITPNGFEDNFVPQNEDFINKREIARKKLIQVAEGLLNQKIKQDAVIIGNSGRYEFRNKGIDIFIETLSMLNNNPNLDREILAYITVPAGHTGPKQELIDNMEAGLSENDSRLNQPVTDEFSTHWLLERKNDHVLKKAQEFNLHNKPEDKVKLIFVPCYLDGNDGIFDMHYYDLLIGFDLTAYPSYYEPWGYTPLESLAFHIPTVTTSLAGFGAWVKDLVAKGELSIDNGGAKVIERDDENVEDVKKEMEAFFLEFTKKNKSQVEKARENAFEVSRTALWSNLVDYYYKSYTMVLEKVQGRADLFRSKQYKEHFEDILRLRKGRPDWKKVLIYPEIPRGLDALQELSMNLWWSWNYEAEELFESIDPHEWKKHHNPVAILQGLTLDQLKELERNDEFNKKLRVIYNRFRSYMNEMPDEKELEIAYFSMEYGIHNSLKIFSGGLGLLAGDYIKEASDRKKNIVAVGLLYRYGFFNQKISAMGTQLSDMTPQKFSQLPIKPVRNENNEWVKIRMALPGRTLYAKAWLVEVGRIKLYLLDTDIDENSSTDRAVTYQLYGGDWENRLKQELLLGVGGIRLLRELNLEPELYHCNEGHGAFINLERLRKLIQEEKIAYPEAVELVRATSLFTTHTPVPAGHDAFSEDYIRAYLPHYAERLNISWNTFMNLGRMYEDDPKENFSLSVLAIKLSQEVNAVSRIHCEVTKDMFSDLWYGYYPRETFIDYVTNGVHFQTWTNKRWQKLYSKYLGAEYISNISDSRTWKKIMQVPDDAIWKTRNVLRKELVEEVKKRINYSYTKRNENPKLIFKTIDQLDENVLTIGFARRFATYKRAHLLFHNLERLEAILNNKERPVQLIYAGKAHPNDKPGQDIITQIINISKMPQFLGKILFLENYDIELAKKMIQGVDVWLNTPQRLMEASGTSGQKAVMNGVLNLSVMDGWWAEGYVPGAGWAITEESTYTDNKFQDELDTEIIYNLLEDEVIPLFYERENNLPLEWIRYIKNCISDIAPHFTTKRMIDEYYEKFYFKLDKRSKQLREKNMDKVRRLVKWKKNIIRSWDRIDVIDINLPDPTKEPLRLGEDFKAEVILNTDIDPEDLGIEVIFGQKENDVVKEILFKEELQLQKRENGHLIYTCNVPANRSGVYDYAFRLYPKNKLLPNRQDFNLIRWI